ncbi:MAG: hypothetical protein KF845_09430 [Cyclobacteriaceae bacterium]|nr:hypothetical protein [Cyclobacteriaceae bacterium]
MNNLPENLLQEVYTLLKKLVSKKETKAKELTVRNFGGRLDNTDIRKAAYEL